MSQATPVITRPPAEVVRQTPVSQAPNGICYAIAGEMTVSSSDLERMVAAVPVTAAAALQRKAYYFVPLTVNQGDETVIADRYDVALSDNAVCHRNLDLGDSQCVFISTRLMDDKFSVAFEFYINVGHAVVERAGVSEAFADLVWKQVESKVRGETSLDAWESRKLATVPGPDAEKYKNEYFAATFPTPFQFIYCRYFSTWITTICANATTRCWLRSRWPSGCAKWRSCFRRIRALSSRCTTSGEPEIGQGLTKFALGLSRSRVQFPNCPPGWSLFSSTEISGLVGEYRTITIRPFQPEIRSSARRSLRARMR